MQHRQTVIHIINKHYLGGMELMKGTSRMYYDGKLYNLSDLTDKEHDQFELKAKKAIAKTLGKKTIKVINN
jgi:hypothetical protein